MDLWVRSQDRALLTKLDYAYLEPNHKREVLGGNHYMINKALGIYKSEERALEVLDEIESILCYKRLEQYSGYSIINVENNVAVYEMPKE